MGNDVPEQDRDEAEGLTRDNNTNPNGAWIARVSRHGRGIFLFVCCLIAAAFVYRQVEFASEPGGWAKAQGHEYLWIAESIAAGEGFSYPAGRRWMFRTDRGKPGMPEYGPTAWKEPIYPYVLGGAMRLLGPENGRAAVVALQVLALALTIVFTYLLGKELMGSWAGLIAAGMIAVLPGPARHAVFYLDTAVLGAMIVTGILLLLLRCMDRPTIGRSLALGTGIGAGALTLAPTVMLGPVAAVALLVESIRRRSQQPLAMVVVAGLSAMLVISPWTIRNAKTFGMFIPIQAGLGNFANYTNTYVAETLMPKLALDPNGSPPPWTSTGPLDAVQKLREGDKRRKLLDRSLESVAANPPPGWEHMSEPERDRVHLDQFRGFVTEHPTVFIQIMMAKALMLFILLPAEFQMSTMWLLSVMMYLVAYVGLVFTLRRRRVYVLPLTVLLVTSPLLVTAPLFYRYRLPVEPLIAILAAGAIVICFKAWVSHSQSFEPAESQL